MNAIIRRSLPAALAASIVAGAIAIPAIAATDDTDSTDSTDDAESTTTESTEDERTDGRAGHHLGRGLEEGELAERLAAELDLETEVVQDALDAVRSDLAAERLAQAVEDGRLTQEQADRIAAAVESGDADALREVRDEVRLENLEARLAAQVEAGELTQEEADDILQRAEDDEFPARRGRRGHRGGGSGPGGPAYDEEVAADTTAA